MNWWLYWNDEFKQHLYSQNTALNYLRHSYGCSYIVGYLTWCSFLKSTCSQALAPWDLRSLKVIHLKISQSHLSCCRKQQHTQMRAKNFNKMKTYLILNFSSSNGKKKNYWRKGRSQKGDNNNYNNNNNILWTLKCYQALCRFFICI